MFHVPANSFIVVIRDGEKVEVKEILGKKIVKFINAKYADNSSTKVRDLIKDGKNLENVVNPKVEEIIKERHLYRS